VLTLAEACSEAVAAAVARSEVPLMLAMISPATRCMFWLAFATVATTLLTSASKRSAIWRCSAFFSSSDRCLSVCCASRSVPASMMLRRNISTAFAIVPSSSRRSLPGIDTSVSPLDRRFMTAVIAPRGRDRPRASRNASRIAAARITTVPRIRWRCEAAAAASYSVVSLTISRIPTGVPA